MARSSRFFSRFARIGRLPQALRDELEPEGIIHVAERVRVPQRFSGSVPGRVSGMSLNRNIGLVVFTGVRLYALLPTIPRLAGAAIDQRWDATQTGPARVDISDTGVRLRIDISRVDPHFRGDVSLHYKTRIPDEVLTTLPSRSLSFTVSPDYVFHMLGVRVKN